MSSKKIYVASSWRNQYQPCVVGLLRKQDHIVYDFRKPSAHLSGFSWSELDDNWQNWTTKQYIKALDHPAAERGFKNDFDAMKWADTCILVLPCGRSAHTEAGWMKGQGKKVYVVSPDKEEPELMYKIYDGIFDNLTDIIVKLAEETCETCENCHFNKACKHEYDMPLGTKACVYYIEKNNS